MEKKNIAILIAGDLYNKKGLINSALTRAKYLIDSDVFVVNVYFIQIYWGWLARHIKSDKLPKYKKVESEDVNGIKINMIWKGFSFLDYILGVKFRMRPLSEYIFNKRISKMFRKNDLLIAHSYSCSEIALMVNHRYNVPFVSSWHGSDIHTEPFRNQYIKQRTITIMECATHNFMCSKQLLDLSLYLTPKASCSLLYNGVSSNYYKFDDIKRTVVRAKYNKEGRKIVAFAGGLVEVKNPLLLPEIFKEIERLMPEIAEFWIIGNGLFFSSIDNKLHDYKLKYKMWGYIESSDMPELLNCVDVLVLPSKNEGLPLIVLEGLACGANVVGSKVGGIPEAIGEENTFELNHSFVYMIANRVKEMLSNHIEQKLNSCFLWDNISSIETRKYQSILNLTIN